MAIKAKGFFGSAKSSFKLGSNNKLRSRFVRSKVNSNKNVKFAKKFFKSDRRLQKRYIRRKTNLLKRQAAEKALEGAQATKTRFKKSLTKKGFNPMKFITMIFVGWIINVLPKIISTLKAWMDKLKPVFDTLKSWVKGIVDFFTMIGTSVGKFVATITGNNATVDAEKKAIEDKNKELKDVFGKQKKGFDDLTNKAKGEEKNLKKDMDDVNKDVNKDLEKEGLSTTSSTGEAILPNSNPAPKLQRDSVMNRKPYTGTNEKKLEFQRKKKELKNLSNYGGTGNPITVEINGVEKTLNPGTSEYAKFFGVKPKNSNTNLKVDSSNKNKVVTVDVPIVRSAPKLQRDSMTTTVNQSNPDSVNSNELLLTSIEK